MDGRAEPVKYLALGQLSSPDDGTWHERVRFLISEDHDFLRSRAVGLTVDPAQASEPSTPTVALLLWAPASHPLGPDSLRDRWPGERWRPLLRLQEHVVQDADYEDRSVIRLGLVRRRETLSREQFGRHWLEEHAPLVLSEGPLFDRYVVNLVADSDSEPDLVVDGVVEQQFADDATRREHDRQVFEDKPAIRADMMTFIAGAEQFIGRVGYRRT